MPGGATPIDPFMYLTRQLLQTLNPLQVHLMLATDLDIIVFPSYLTEDCLKPPYYCPIRTTNHTGDIISSLQPNLMAIS